MDRQTASSDATAAEAAAQALTEEPPPILKQNLSQLSLKQTVESERFLQCFDAEFARCSAARARPTTLAKYAKTWVTFMSKTLASSARPGVFSSFIDLNRTQTIYNGKTLDKMPGVGIKCGIAEKVMVEIQEEVIGFFSLKQLRAISKDSTTGLLRRPESLDAVVTWARQPNETVDANSLSLKDALRAIEVVTDDAVQRLDSCNDVVFSKTKKAPYVF